MSVMSGNITRPGLRVWGWLLVVYISLQPYARTAASSGDVRIGVLAKRGAVHCMQRWAPMADYLIRQIPDQTFRIIPLDFEQIYPAVEDGRVDFILANSSFYVELESWYGVQRIATLQNKRLGGVHTYFGGVIFARSDRSDLRRLSDLKGRRFTAVKETSLGGWRMAWREFLERGIDPRSDFESLSFVGTHDQVVYDVLEGKTDAGTVRTDTLERMALEGKVKLDQFYVFELDCAQTAQIGFVHSTRVYPEWPVAKVKHTPDGLARQVAVALMQMPPDHPAAQAANIAGWTIPLNYQSVHVCLQALKVGPYSQAGKISPWQVLQTFKWWILSGVATVFALVMVSISTFKMNRRLEQSNARLQDEVEKRRTAVEALKESELFAHTIISSVGDGIVVFDDELRYRIWNRRMEEFTGLKEDDVIGRTAMDIFPHQGPSLVNELVGSARKGQCAISPDTAYHIDETGRAGWMVGHYCPHLNASGQVMGVVGVISDITERKKIETELVASNERFRTVMDALDALVYVADMATHELLFINKYGRDRWGDTTGKPCWKILQAQQDGPCSFCTNPLLLDGESKPSGVHVWEFQNTINGHWYQCHDQAIKWTDGRYVRLEIATDITLQINVQNQLLRQNQFFNTVLESLTHPFLVIETESHLVQIANPAVGDHYHGKTCYQLTHASQRPCSGDEHVCPIEHIKRTGQPVVTEHVHRNKDGELRNYDVHGYPIFDDNGKISRIIEYAIDVTDRKKAEKALQEKEEYLHTIMATIQTGVLISEKKSGRIVDLNPWAAQMIGMPSEALVGQPWSRYIKRVSADSLKAARGLRSVEGEIALLETREAQTLNVRLSEAQARIRDRQYTIHGFLDISDIHDLLDQQAVNIGLAKQLLKLVAPETARYCIINDRVGLHIEALSLSCLAAGGDHFFVRTLPAGKNGRGAVTHLSLKDQSGHEVNCILRSIVTDLAHNTLLTQRASAPLKDLLGNLNEQLLASGMFAEDDFLTAVMAQIDHQTLDMQYACCGHPPFILIREDRVVSLPANGGLGHNLPLGIVDGVEYSIGRIRLRIGDRLLFYTDGLTEMPHEKRGWKLTRRTLEETVAKLIDARPDGRVTDLMDDLIGRMAGLSGHQVAPPGTNTSADDVTIIGMEIEAHGSREEAVRAPRDSDDLNDWITRLHQRIVTPWERSGLSNAARRVRTVLEEAVLNAWKNAHLRSPEKPITVRWREGNDFHLEVIDQGDGFDPRSVADPTTLRNRLSQSGRGIFMMRMVSDALYWHDNGRHLIADFHRNPRVARTAELIAKQQQGPFWSLLN